MVTYKVVLTEDDIKYESPPTQFLEEAKTIAVGFAGKRLTWTWFGDIAQANEDSFYTIERSNE